METSPRMSLAGFEINAGFRAVWLWRCIWLGIQEYSSPDSAFQRESAAVQVWVSTTRSHSSKTRKDLSHPSQVAMLFVQVPEGLIRRI